MPSHKIGAHVKRISKILADINPKTLQPGLHSKPSRGRNCEIGEKYQKLGVGDSFPKQKKRIRTRAKVKIVGKVENTRN